MSESTNERAARERQQYNTGLQREYFDRIFQHCLAYSDTDVKTKLQQSLSYGHGKTVLELGSSCWQKWLEPMEVHPRHLYCINISEKELERGKQLTANTKTQPVFQLMDAHNLGFVDETFDLVYGDGILHHFDVQEALQEIHRVLKPEGRIVFVEPLGINPVAKVVRYLTPKARTIDEQPFRLKELSILKSFFNVSMYTFDLFSSLLSIPSELLFKNPQNPLMYLSYKLDVFCLLVLPPIRYLSYRMLIIGEKCMPGSIMGKSSGA